jgi:hypothetical protein
MDSVAGGAAERAHRSATATGPDKIRGVMHSLALCINKSSSGDMWTCINRFSSDDVWTSVPRRRHRWPMSSTTGHFQTRLVVNEDAMIIM